MTWGRKNLPDHASSKEEGDQKEKVPEPFFSPLPPLAPLPPFLLPPEPEFFLALGLPELELPPVLPLLYRLCLGERERDLDLDLDLECRRLSERDEKSKEKET